MPCGKNPIKKKKRISKLSCQSLQLGENYTEIKAWQLNFAAKLNTYKLTNPELFISTELATISSDFLFSNYC